MQGDWLGQGRHQIPFAVRLPDHAPPSYHRRDGDEQAEVLYYLRSKVRISEKRPQGGAS